MSGKSLEQRIADTHAVIDSTSRSAKEDERFRILSQLMLVALNQPLLLDGQPVYLVEDVHRIIGWEQ